MGQWTTTAPTLPSGRQWLQGKTMSGSANHWGVTISVHIASLSTSQFAVRLVTQSGVGSYSDYYPPDTWSFECYGETTNSFGVSRGEQTFYYIGNASAGTNITTSFLKGSSAINTMSVSQTVPAGTESYQLWTTTAPTLLPGTNWSSQKNFNTGSANHWSISGGGSIVRLAGNRFAIKLNLTSGDGEYGTYYPPGNWSLRCDIGEVTGSANTSFGVNKGTSTYYFIGEALGGVSLTITINGASGSAVSNRVLYLTTPSLLCAVPYVNINGAWRQGTNTYININGSWKEGLIHYNSNGTWKI